MFRHILVAVDGSKHAMRAAVAAIEMAQRYGSELEVLTVVKKPSAEISEQLRHYMEVENIPATLDEMVDRRSREILEQVEEHGRKKGLEKIRKVVKTGQPARTIVAHAKQAGADLIVMGSRGLGDIEGMLLGSVSHKVSTLAECSCLTVR
jgi:nucleotide-binding universal stress UspA family protein